ncbi:MarR family winged helix-turn-helix transcriptional regulator [Neomicrococcus aestuarii]|uniref:Transcriptional regulator n=1 Tax=Neomicrococcus aestuarii TaxID=556325 RepID=A0A1L2ZN67_9MICC|nr:transcriptional regulator [Neomicrococcus aestuarii]APF40865.1 transcriptional regulator [Neomicrococcus aestuarii]
MSEQPIGYWVKLVDSLITERFQDALEEHGVTRRQWMLLNHLRSGAASGGELTEALSPFFGDPVPEGEPRTPSEHLAELVESGWVLEDGHMFSLTERGNLSLERLTEIVDGIRTSATENIEPIDFATTVSTLRTMAANLGYREGQTAPPQ